MGRHELQNMPKLFWRVGVHLGRQAQLREAEPSELEQCIVTRDAPLEQGMNGAKHLLACIGIGRADSAETITTWPGTIHDFTLGRSCRPR
jgi:hypothetical protein